MARNLLHLSDPERIAIKNRLGKILRFLGEHSIPKQFIIDNYGDTNILFALLDEAPDKEMPLIEAVALGVFDRAMKGDIRALEFIRDTIGEKPATNINVTGETTTSLASLSEAQLKSLADKMSKSKAVEGAEDAEYVDKPDNIIDGDTPFGDEINGD